MTVEAHIAVACLMLALVAGRARRNLSEMSRSEPAAARGVG